MMIVWQGAHIPVSDACRLCFTNILLILLGSFYRDPKTPHALASIPFCPSVLLCWDAESLGGLPWGARTVIFLILTVCCSSRSLSLISPFQRKSQEEIKSYDYPLLLSLKATRLSFSRRDCVTNITHIPRSSPYQNSVTTRCSKITEKVSFNIASEASYVYDLSGQKYIKMPKMVNFG